MPSVRTMSYKNFIKIHDLLLLFFLRYFPLHFATRNLDVPVKKKKKKGKKRTNTKNVSNKMFSF